MNLVTIVVVLLLVMAFISAIVVLSAVALGGRARQFEDEPDVEPDVITNKEPVDR